MKKAIISMTLLSMAQLTITQASAIELTQASFQAMESSIKMSYDWDANMQRSNPYDKGDSVAKKIVLQSKMLDYLAHQTSLNIKQQQWLINARKSPLKIDIPSLHHPDQTINVINIGDKAKAVMQLHKDRETAGKLERRWKQGDFHHDEIADLAKKARRQVLILFLNRLSFAEQKAFADNLVTLLSDSNSTVISEYGHMMNQLIPLTLNKELLAIMLSGEANEFTHQLIQKLEDSFSKQEALELLLLAANNKSIRSQSYLLLAKNHHDSAVAAEFIAGELIHNERYWHALMVISPFVKSGFAELFLEIADELPEALKVKVIERVQGAQS